MSIGAKENQGPSVGSMADLRSTVFNLPNQLTWLRLLLSIVLFATIAAEYYWASLVLFVVAAGTDWLDGYFARKYGMITTLGRILDPFADKVIVCGTFIYLAAIPGSGVAAWMVVVIVGRELLVTALRSFLEQQGADFSATLSGKLKMVLQCAAAGTCLFSLTFTTAPGGSPPAWLAGTPGGWQVGLLAATVWSAVALTVISGVAYVRTAINLLRR
jgi:CDP-diacylglycerol--glycerol-3-phosphate 3-phosphatidyltransferase